MSQKDKHKTFVWEYFDRGISKSSKGVTDEAKCKNCAAVIRCTGVCVQTSGLLRHLESKYCMDEPSSTQSDVSSNTQSASSAKRLLCYFQATLHSFMNKETREEIVAKLVAVDGFPPSVVCKNEFICQAISDKGMLFQKIKIIVCNQYINSMKLQKMLL